MSEEQMQNVLPLLPEPLRRATNGWAREYLGKIEELRLRMGQRLLLLCGAEELFLPTAPVSAQDIQIILERAAEFSLYRCAESIRSGFLTVRGGCRIGLCGTAVCRGGEIATLQDISSLSIRIARELPGVAAEIYPQLWQDGHFESTLIIAPPGCGKTTFLRDLVRLLSTGGAYAPLRVAVVDERCEIAATLSGVPQFDLGARTDVLSAAEKTAGILMLLRAMAPDVIAVDEITDPADIQAMVQAGNCGVSFLATVHGRDLEELRRRRVCRELLETELFRRFVILERQGQARRFRVERW